MTSYTLTLKVKVPAKNFRSASAKADRLKAKLETKQHTVCEARLTPEDPR